MIRYHIIKQKEITNVKVSSVKKKQLYNNFLCEIKK